MNPVSIADKGIFEQCRDEFFRSLQSENNISDLCFCNLLTWSDSLKTRRIIADGFYCASVEFMGQWYHYIPLGKLDKLDTYEKLLEHIYPDKTIELIMTPEVFLPYLKRLKNYKISYSHDENYSDYIYDNVSFAGLLQNKSNRYDYNHFKRNHAPVFCVVNSQNKADCLKVMDKFWCSRRDCSNCHYGCERKALQNALTHFDTLQLSGALVYANAEPVAFVIAKKLNPELIAYHFMKVNSDMRGLQIYLLHSFATECHSGVSRINFSEDMGIEGLRIFKQRLAPFAQVHKYNVILTRCT
ncbi:MAG: phosphatidylglycerol lysyltransferase domain-containing protein [Oscillospiraceae bacterium]|nr:phosphatidylglycerol lysyltransferase domain-containing protein [Oscillospiraceae bacterium]